MLPGEMPILDVSLVLASVYPGCYPGQPDCVVLSSDHRSVPSLET